MSDDTPSPPSKRSRGDELPHNSTSESVSVTAGRPLSSKHKLSSPILHWFSRGLCEALLSAESQLKDQSRAVIKLSLGGEEFTIHCTDAVEASKAISAAASLNKG